MQSHSKDKIVSVHIGCGSNPLDGFINFDYNIFIFFKYIPFSIKLLRFFKFIPKPFSDFVKIAKEKNILYANAAKKIPMDESSVDLIYTCHMLEHLDWEESIQFFSEAFRVLKDGCILRVVVPDFDYLINKYGKNNDVENFIRLSCLVGEKPKTIIKKMQYLLQGHGWHHQIFNGESLEKFQSLPFSNISKMKPGVTNIKLPTTIDFYERSHESIYFEFTK